MYQRRMAMFTLKAARRRWVGFDLMGLGVWATSGPNGHFLTDLQVSDDKLPLDIPEHGRPVSLTYTTLPTEDGRTWSSQVFFVPPQGISVISDIDDTIKLTEVKDRRKMLSNTFLYDFVAVDGMNELYSLLKDKGAAFHYVSNSPWQLQPDLQDFLNQANFPQGSFHLKHLRFRLNKPITFLKNRLGLRPKQQPEKHTTAAPAVPSPAGAAVSSERRGGGHNHKYDTVYSLLQTFPERKFILVGDSGEKDPL
eukprot:jgi/Bigna1/65663/fgenesh1_kg.122_\